MTSKLFFLKTVFVIAMLFIFNSSANSQSWLPIGPSGGQKYLSLHLDTTNNTLFVSTTEGFWYTYLGSNEWRPRVEVDWIGRAVWSINSNPDVPGRIISGRDNAFFKGYMELSNDYGETNEITFSSEGGYISDIKYSPSNPDIFYACGFSDMNPGDLLKSTDGGQTWSQLYNYQHSAMTSIAISSTNSDNLFVSGNALVTRSDNGGQSWVSASGDLPSALGVYCVAMSSGDENSLICSNDNGLYQTTNSGDNWKQIYEESCKQIIYNPVNPNMIAVVTFNTSQILLSTNNGSTWVDFTGNFPTQDYIKDIVFTADGEKLIATSYYGVYSKVINIFTGIQNNFTDCKSHLHQNCPNPFTMETTIEFTLENQQNVYIDIIDITGKQIYILKSENMPAGKHSVIWDGKNIDGNNVYGGVYFCRLTLENKTREVKSMIKTN